MTILMPMAMSWHDNNKALIKGEGQKEGGSRGHMRIQLMIQGRRKGRTSICLMNWISNLPQTNLRKNAVAKTGRKAVT